MPVSTRELPAAIDVAAGVLTDSTGRVLIAQRPAAKPMGGAWEFPGGKIRAAETPLQGLARELHEELGIHVRCARHLVRYTHAYPERPVRLFIWKVLGWEGEPRGAEGQPLRWCPPERLLDEGLLPADREIVDRLLADAAVNRLTPLAGR